MTYRVARLLGVAAACFVALTGVAHAVEPDGALIRLTTNNFTYRIVGGAPLHISSCTYTNNCEGRKDVANLTGYRTTPLDGAMIVIASNGTYRFAGGAPLQISRCSYGPGCGAQIQVDAASLTDTAHVRAMPPDGTVIRNFDDGGFYRFAGGAPLLVRCDIGAGCVNPPLYDNGTFQRLGTPTPATPHMRQYPANGTVVYNADDNAHYRFAGNALMPIAPVTGAKQIIDSRTIVTNGTALAALPHIAPAPADTTFLNAAGTFYRVAGGAAVHIVSCVPLSACPGAVAVDPGTISGHAGGRLLAVPKDGTLLRGLPSNTLWEIVGGARRQSFVNAPGITIDDGGISEIPLPAAPAPVIQPTPAAPAFAPIISSTYSVSRKGTRFRSLSVRDVPAGSKVSVHCSHKTRGCPYRSKNYTISTGKGSLLGKLRTHRLRTGVTLSVKITGPTGARKQMDFKMRSNRLPTRKVSCAAPGGRLGKC
jgi:hypothetical protein